MYFLASDNTSMWTLGNIFGIVFFIVIFLLGFVVYRLVAGGSSKSNLTETDE